MKTYLILNKCMFQKLLCANASQFVCMWERVKIYFFSENGISSTREGSGLLVPLHKLEYQTGCLNFYGVLSSTSTLDVHVASATQTDIYHIGLYSDNLFDGQVNISMSETKR